MKLGNYSVGEVRKFVVAACGALALLATSFLDEFAGLIPDGWSGPITWLIGTATAAGVFLTKNAPVIDSLD